MQRKQSEALSQNLDSTTAQGNKCSFLSSKQEPVLRWTRQTVSLESRKIKICAFGLEVPNLWSLEASSEHSFLDDPFWWGHFHLLGGIQRRLLYGRRGNCYHGALSLAGYADVSFVCPSQHSVARSEENECGWRRHAVSPPSVSIHVRTERIVRDTDEVKSSHTFWFWLSCRGLAK